MLLKITMPLIDFKDAKRSTAVKEKHFILELGKMPIPTYGTYTLLITAKVF